MSTETRATIRDLMGLRLKCTATLQLQTATALTGKGQDELRKHFLQSAELMLEAMKELSNG